MTRKVTLTVTGAAKVGSRWRVNGKNKRGRSLKFTTTRPDFSKGQRVTVTCQKIRRDGTLEKARFSALENVQVDRKLITGKQSRTKTRQFCQAVAQILGEFRDGLGEWKSGVGCRSGRIKIEGFIVEVDAQKLSWFRTPDGVHHPFGAQVGSWILKQMGGLY